MSAAPTLTWEQYQQLPADQRRRPLSAAEYAALTPSQLQSAGFADSSDGAPANFSGPVFPNPDHVQPSLDTDSSIPATRLPNGVSFQKGNYQGGAQGDLSNPAPTEAMPAMGREVAADMSAQPTPHPSGATVPMIFDGDSSGQAHDVPFEQLHEATQNGGKVGVYVKFKDDSSGKNRVVPADQIQDAVKNGGTIVPIEEQPKGVPELYGFTPANVARNAWSGFKGTISSVGSLAKDLLSNPDWVNGPNSTLKKFVEDPMHQEAAKAVDAFGKGNYTEAFGHALSSGLPVIGPGAAQIGEQAGTGDVGGAVGKAAGTVAGAEALNLGAKGIEAGTNAAIDAALESPKAVATVPVRLASRAAETAINQKLVPLRPLANIMSPADAAEGTQFKVPGRDFGLEPPTKAPAPELDATGENRDYAGAPAPKPAKVLDATGENKPFAGGMDEYTPPKASVKTAPAKPAPRTVVIDPESGAPEFSDVVAQKQSAAQTTPQPKSAPAAASQTTDPILARLQDNASRIQAEESSAKTSSPAEDDLTDILQKSVDQAKAGRAAKDAGKTIEVPGQGEVPRFVYRARTVGEEGVPATDVAAHATSDFDQAMKFAEPGQRGADWGQVVRIDLSKLKPEDFSVRQHPDGMSWVKFKRGLSEDEVTPFAGQMASAE